MASNRVFRGKGVGVVAPTVVVVGVAGVAVTEGGSGEASRFILFTFSSSELSECRFRAMTFRVGDNDTFSYTDCLVSLAFLGSLPRLCGGDFVTGLPPSSLPKLRERSLMFT